MRCACGTLQGLSEAIGSVALPVATALVALAAAGIVLGSAIHVFRGPGRAREILFVARWGVFGPELYRVGKDVRRLAGPGDHVAIDFARQMLGEVMRCRPATGLARAFAAARLDPLPPDGFVLSTSDVEVWLATGAGAARGRFTPRA